MIHSAVSVLLARLFFFCLCCRTRPVCLVKSSETRASVPKRSIEPTGEHGRQVPQPVEEEHSMTNSSFFFFSLFARRAFFFLQFWTFPVG